MWELGTTGARAVSPVMQGRREHRGWSIRTGGRTADVSGAAHGTQTEAVRVSNRELCWRVVCDDRRVWQFVTQLTSSLMFRRRRHRMTRDVRVRRIRGTSSIFGLVWTVKSLYSATNTPTVTFFVLPGPQDAKLAFVVLFPTHSRASLSAAGSCCCC